MPTKPNAKPPHDTPPAALREDGFVGTGHIWCPTGSDKTITPFKAATLLKENDSSHDLLLTNVTKRSKHDPWLLT